MTDADLTTPDAAGRPPGADAPEAILAELRKAVVGQDAALEALLVALLCDGHVLLEGVPGTAKTLMARALSRALDLRYGRIQFTPDLMPADIVGTNVFDIQQGAFRLVKGPVFTNVLLADEINRAPAKTQSALLEAMEERRATIDGVAHEVSRVFLCLATQNPLEHEGTYPLPEAQLDRFLLKVQVELPAPEEEERILRAADAGFDARDLEAAGLRPVLDQEGLLALRAAVGAIRCAPELIGYIRRVVAATRDAPRILVGAGPRASLGLLRASKALAVLRGRDFVTPDDIKELSLPVLRHRVILDADAELEGLSPDAVVAALVEAVEVPR